MLLTSAVAVTVVMFLFWLAKFSCLDAAVPMSMWVVLTFRTVVSCARTVVVRGLIPGRL